MPPPASRSAGELPLGSVPAPSPDAGSHGRHRPLPLRIGLLVLVLAASSAGRDAAAAVYRDELTFLGKTRYLLRDYALVVPVDVKRQPLQNETFVEVKAWGAWNGAWVPYIYEPVKVPGTRADDLNDIMTRYRQTTKDSRLAIRRGPLGSITLTYAKGGTTFDLRTSQCGARVRIENPEGLLTLGVTAGELDVNGRTVAGRVACVRIVPGWRGATSGRYGLYDHFTLVLPSGAILVVYHSRNRPGFNLGALLTPDSMDDRDWRSVRVVWRKPWADAASGREVPSAWTVESLDADVKAELEEWGRDVVRYKTDAGRLAVAVNAMVRGWVEIAGVRMQVFGLNVHIQDE